MAVKGSSKGEQASLKPGTGQTASQRTDVGVPMCNPGTQEAAAEEWKVLG